MFLQFVADNWFLWLIISGSSLFLAIEIARTAKYINRLSTIFLVFAFFIFLCLTFVGVMVNVVTP